MSEAKHTPGPWEADGLRVWSNATDDPVYIASLKFAGDTSVDLDEAEANCDLIAAAPDHALVARMLAAGSLRWESWGPDGRGELCIDGLRHVTKLDEFGVPELTQHLRARVLLSCRSASPSRPATPRGSA